MNKSSILELLYERKDYVSGQELCDHFGVSRTAVWKVINQLKEDGYEIESVTRKGYRLVSAPDLMNADEIKAAMKRLGIQSGQMGQELLYFEQVDSTNTKAAQLSELGYASGTLVVSDEQTAGKGRRGRNWSSLPGDGIYMTLLLKPDIEPNHASQLTLVAALAVSRAISDTLAPMENKATPLIKWPNDIVMNGRKVCGILTEMSMQVDYINHLVIGIGINVHNRNFPEEIRATAGSIWTESGCVVKRAELIARFLGYFNQYYKVFLETEDLSRMAEEYNTLLVNRDREVKVLDPKGAFTGVAKGIAGNGELIVETPQQVVHVSGGEVSVRGIYGYV